MMPIKTKPTQNDVIIRVRINTSTYGLKRFDSVAEMVEEAEKICEQIQRHCDGVYAADVCSEADGALVELNNHNRSEWRDSTAD